VFGLFGRIGLDLMLASLAPYDEAKHARRQRFRASSAGRVRISTAAAPSGCGC
jgi:hypothetical protein